MFDDPNYQVGSSKCNASVLIIGISSPTQPSRTAPTPAQEKSVTDVPTSEPYKPNWTHTLRPEASISKPSSFIEKYCLHIPRHTTTVREGSVTSRTCWNSGPGEPTERRIRRRLWHSDTKHGLLLQQCELSPKLCVACC